MNNYNYILFATLLLGTVLCQDDTDFNNLNLDDLKDKIPGFNESALPNKEEVEKVFREKCEKNGGPGAYDDIMNSKDSIQKCFEQHINTTVIMEQLNEAKKDGSMDEVFGKYCKKRAEILNCVKDITNKIDKCLEPSEKDNLKIVMNVTESLVDFVCFKDGDRLAMFVAQGGFECLQESKENLQQCANSTLKNKLPSDLSINNLPLFVIGDNECSDMFKLQTCVVSELEKCKDNTPANIVEALFKFIKKATPCKNFDPKKMPQLARKLESSDSNVNVASFVLIFSAIIMKFIH